jgi:penicillin-binding protein 1A
LQQVGRTILRLLKKLCIALLIVGFVSALAGGGVLYYFVAVEPGPAVAEENIKKILGRESPVLYNDGVTRLGVFFADAHRQYVEFDEIPRQFIDALVAAEDNRYFSHYGFDVVGIARAMVRNVEAGRIVQGGSSLTQQTAKNLFKRKNRSIQEKLKELLYALRLEYHYSKEQILEFYANQFYVSGNGHGLGVAARYYFDKKPEELDLLEAAYIAGSVKRPNAYNPFIKQTEADVAAAKQRGLQRVYYVLGQMRELEMIDESQFRQAIARDVPFNQGSFGYSLDYVMELATEAVSSEDLIEALAAQGIDNISTSGIRIITTVNKGIQEKTLAALRTHLSYLDVRLRGYDRQTVQEELARREYSGDSELKPGAFLFGRVTSVDDTDDSRLVTVELGKDMGTGVIDNAGIAAMVDGWVKFDNNRWSEPKAEDTARFLTQLQPDDQVWVSVRQVSEEEEPLLDLQRFGEVQGGAIVLRNGKIVAVAGGTENRFFNRAVYGRRTMGSSYKPFVYAAALQLGWHPTDQLPNRRDVFVYQNMPYYPRPDHEIEHDPVSMSWAGVKSENLASVWLTAHLCDHLSRSQLLAVADRFGLARREVEGELEPYRLFQSRLRDRYGIVMDRDAVREAAFRKMQQHIYTDLLFEGLEQEYETIRQIRYGARFEEFDRQLDEELAILRAQSSYPEYEERELLLRKRLLKNNFLRLERLRDQLTVFLNSQDPSGSAFSGSRRPTLIFDPGQQAYLFMATAEAPTGGRMVNRDRLLQFLQTLDTSARKTFFEEIRLDNRISVAAFDFTRMQLEADYRGLLKLPPYSIEVLEYVDDYRILVGLHYLIGLGREMGIESDLQPVLSFPLGANVVSLLETTRVYEALATGETALFYEQSGDINNTLAIIDRIESEDGTVIYRPEPTRKRTLTSTTSLEVGHILENTVKFGTGRQADREVTLSPDGLDADPDDTGLSVPLLGKTGTANRYTNASFFGYLPAVHPDGNGLVLADGFAVGVYTGYDDNKPMRRRTTRVTGSLGALPAWIGIVNAIIAEENYVATLDPVDLTFYGLAIDRADPDLVNLAIVPENGGILAQPPRLIDPLNRYQPSIMTIAQNPADDQNTRLFSPYWEHEVDRSAALVLGDEEQNRPLEEQSLSMNE